MATFCTLAICSGSTATASKRFFLRRAIHTMVSITGISMRGPTTVETATIGIDAKNADRIGWLRKNIGKLHTVKDDGRFID